MDLKSSEKKKLAILDLFQVLQEEYIVCELRSKIYPTAHYNSAGIKINHSEYWRLVAEKKKEKIFDIARRKNIISIFDHESFRKNIEVKLIPQIGYPNFIYRDSKHQLMQEKWDLHNYYSKGSEVSVSENDKLLFGYIDNIDFKHKKVYVRLKDSELVKIFDFSIVTRVFI